MFDKGNAMLVWMLQPETETEDEWNEWYNLEHLAGLLQVPGFISGNRYHLASTLGIGVAPTADVPDYLAFYELFNDAVLESDAYVARRLSRVPGMRPFWTQRMLGAITQAYGGVYVPHGDTRVRDPEVLTHRIDDLAVLSFSANPDSQWIDDVVEPALSRAAGVAAFRSLTLLRGSPPIEGMRERMETPKQVVFCAVDGIGNLETLSSQLDLGGATDATLALYKRWL